MKGWKWKQEEKEPTEEIHQNSLCNRVGRLERQMENMVRQADVHVQEIIMLRRALVNRDLKERQVEIDWERKMIIVDRERYEGDMFSAALEYVRSMCNRWEVPGVMLYFDMPDPAIKLNRDWTVVGRFGDG